MRATIVYYLKGNLMKDEEKKLQLKVETLFFCKKCQLN